MLKIDTIDSGNLIEIESKAEYDYSNGDCPTSPNLLVYEINPGWKLRQMETDFDQLKSEFDRFKFQLQDLLDREEEERKMREDWPALQDEYEQYQMVKNMLQNAKKPKEEQQQ